MTNQENRASAFRTDCRLVNMKQEYPGYTGKAKWMLVSSLSEPEVMEKYAEELRPYMPFIYVTREMFAPIAESHHNDRKHEIRDAKLRDAFPYEDGLFETFHAELVCDPFSEPDWSLLYEAIDQLTDIQKERIRKRFFLQLNMVEIAAEEGTTKQAVEKSTEMIPKQYNTPLRHRKLVGLHMENRPLLGIYLTSGTILNPDLPSGNNTKNAVNPHKYWVFED